MTAFLSANLAPIMFGAVMLFLLTGFPVAFSLAASGLLFGWIGIELGLLPASLFAVLPLRVLGIMQNETLLAIPFFTLMGLILERSGMAEDLLDTIGQVFGAVRGGLALAVVVVGALLAATTGVVAASVISMGLISLPIMLRYGYSRGFASGVITASGSLAQALPPSIVLIVLADQLGRSVGDMYRGAFLPAFILIALYATWVAAVAIVTPHKAPALPPEARRYKEPDGRSGHASLAALMALLTLAGMIFARHYADLLGFWQGKGVTVARDETVVASLMACAAVALLLALLNRTLRLGLLSQLSERVVFVLIPPLALIFLVLGSIFVGLATPTEGGALGAIGALVMATLRGRMTLTRLRQALQATARLSVFVMFILIGATVFSFTFTAIEGKQWIEELFALLPGGELGFILFVNLLIFVLGFFLDFFEIAFILIPLLAPVAQNMGLDLVWFGIMIAINLQTSFLTPPFGFALFYLRSVAPRSDYIDRITRLRVAGVRTADIYRGSIAFIVIQLVLLGLIIAFPQLVTGSLPAAIEVDPEMPLFAPGDEGGWGTDDWNSGQDSGWDAPTDDGWN